LSDDPHNEKTFWGKRRNISVSYCLCVGLNFARYDTDADSHGRLSVYPERVDSIFTRLLSIRKMVIMLRQWNLGIH
jgi:hypothetical protein